MSDARRRAEEALATVAMRYPNGWGAYDTLSVCTDALRALLAEPAPACGSVSTVRSDDPPATPLPTCVNCGSNFITPAPPDATEHPCGCYAPEGDHCHRHPAPPAADEVREALAAARELLAAVRTGHLASIGAERNVYVPQIGVAWLTPLADKIELGAALDARRRG